MIGRKWQTDFHRDFIVMRAPAADAAMAEAGLPDALENPLELSPEDWAAQPFCEGGKSVLSTVGNGEIIVKRHVQLEDRYGDEHGAKRVSQSNILRNVRTNIKLERSLKNVEGYTTPQYLAHLMVRLSGSSYAHYTFMTRLEWVNIQRGEASFEEYGSRLQRAERVSRLALLKAVYTPLLHWDSNYPNFMPVQNERGSTDVAVLDQEAAFRLQLRLTDQAAFERARRGDPLLLQPPHPTESYYG